MLASSYPRVDFDADFRVGRKIKMLACEPKQILKLLWSQICRGTAAPMELHYRAIARDSSSHLFDFSLQNIEIRYRDAFVFLNNYVTRAKQTQAFAEGKMHVQRNGCLRPLRLGVDGFEIIRTERVIPDWRSGVAGVTRSRAIISAEKFFIDLQFLAHALEGWSSERHVMILSANTQRKLADSFCPPSQRPFAARFR